MKKGDKIRNIISELKIIQNGAKCSFREESSFKNSQDIKGLHDNFHEAISNLVSASITIDFLEGREK